MKKLLILLLLMIPIASASFIPYYFDDFDDNSINTSIWTTFTKDDGSSVSEVNAVMNFSANEGFAHTGTGVHVSGVDRNLNWTIEFDYREGNWTDQKAGNDGFWITNESGFFRDEFYGAPPHGVFIQFGRSCAEDRLGYMAIRFDTASAWHCNWTKTYQSNETVGRNSETNLTDGNYHRVRINFDGQSIVERDNLFVYVNDSLVLQARVLNGCGDEVPCDDELGFLTGNITFLWHQSHFPHATNNESSEIDNVNISYFNQVPIFSSTQVNETSIIRGQAVNFSTTVRDDFGLSSCLLELNQTNVTEQTFFENCDDISDWTIDSPPGLGGTWEVAGGACRAIQTQDALNMTHGPMDLSGVGIEFVNFSFDIDNLGLDAGETIEIWVNNSTSDFQSVFSTGSNDPLFESFNLSEFITLDDGVHIRATCKNDGLFGEHCQWDNINVTVTNSTGGPRNSTIIGLSGLISNCSVVDQIFSPVGTNITWRFWANDSDNQGVFSDLQSFIVDELDIIAPSVDLLDPANDITIVSVLNATFICNVSDATGINNVTLYANWSGEWHSVETNTSGLNDTNYSFNINIDQDYANRSDGFDPEPAGVLRASSIATNGSDIWIIDFIDDFMYHFNANGDNLSDGFNIISDISTARGMDTNGSDFWIVDGPDDFVYHLDAEGNNITDGFDLSGAGASTSGGGVATNGSDFWVTDLEDDFLFHYNADGDNLSDGFNMSGFGIGDPRGVVTNGSDFWISDGGDNYIYHLNDVGENLSDGIRIQNLSGNDRPLDIASETSFLHNTGGDASPINFWVIDGTFNDPYVHHIQRGVAGTYNWSCQACDTRDNCGFADPNFTITFSVNSCNPSAPLSVDHQYECSDACIIISDVDANGFNVVANGSGNLTFDGANLFNYTIFTVAGESTTNQCTVNCLNDGCFGL